MTEDENYLKQELYALLKTDTQTFEFLQQGCLDGLWFQDLENPEFEWMNEDFWRLLGHDPATKEHLASMWQEAVNKDDLSLLRSNFNEHYRNPRHPYDQIIRFAHKDGSTVWVRRRGMAIRDENGVPKRMLGVHINVTKQMSLMQQIESRTYELRKIQAEPDLMPNGHGQMEVELRSTAERAEQAERLKTRMLSNLSHELRTPLNAIIGLSKILEDKAGQSIGQGKQAEYVHLIHEAGNQLLQVVDKIIVANAGEPATTPLDLEQLNAGQIAKGCMAMMQDKAKDARLNLTIDSSDTLPALVADRAKVKQALLNLLSNSIKFTPPGGEVKIACVEQSDCSIAFQVSDSGYGMDSDQIPDVIKPFMKANYDMIQSESGAGLGLFLTQQILDQHGGSMEIESRCGEGTSVTVAFPAATAQLDRCDS